MNLTNSVCEGQNDLRKEDNFTDENLCVAESDDLGFVDIENICT